MEDRYLGDGVYASYDSDHIWLDLRGQYEPMKIALTQDVFDRLVQFRDDILKEINTK